MSTRGKEAEDACENTTLISSGRDASLECKATGTQESLSQENPEKNDLDDQDSYNPPWVIMGESAGNPPPLPPKSPLKNSESVSLSILEYINPRKAY